MFRLANGLGKVDKFGRRLRAQAQDTDTYENILYASTDTYAPLLVASAQWQTQRRYNL